MHRFKGGAALVKWDLSIFHRHHVIWQLWKNTTSRGGIKVSYWFRAPKLSKAWVCKLVMDVDIRDDGYHFSDFCAQHKSLSKSLSSKLEKLSHDWKTLFLTWKDPQSELCQLWKIFTRGFDSKRFILIWAKPFNPGCKLAMGVDTKDDW